jgi:lipopolysaccharide/colanic/teichoic acid biosynthesis glycosyltransferase
MSFALSNESANAMRAEAISEERTSAPAQAIGNGIPRWADFTIAAIGLIVAGPVIAVTALAIAASSGMPVFFRQKRVGRRGEMFELYKLRTMKSSMEGPQVTSRGDGRITSLGRFLRRTKLDELPSLWNVLRGDMALVGPRPEVPRYVRLEDPQWQVILQVRPGITDPVTLRLRNEEDLMARASGDPETYYLNELQPSKLNGYVSYLQQRTCRGDLSMLWRTVVEVATKNAFGA